MDDRPMDQERIDAIVYILNAVQLRVRNETERSKQRDQLIQVKNAALQDAQNKIKFLADMSHEIRTPMNAVIALTDLLLQERHLLNEEQVEHLEVIQTSGNHLLTVINDILDISKINHDPKFKLENRRFSLRKCVKDALNMARHQASMTQQNKLVCLAECPLEINDNVPLDQLIHQLNPLIPSPRHTKKTVLPLIWKIDPHAPDYVMGDSMRLTQILLNLCSNAVKFTKSGGIRVKVGLFGVPSETPFKTRYDATQIKYESTGLDEHQVTLEISVTDTGIGMPADRLPRLFKSFSQIDISTARRYGGTGLGLAISNLLVNRMGGELWVESQEGLGSRFALTVPLTVPSPPYAISTTKSSDSNSLTSPPSPNSSISDGSVDRQLLEYSPPNKPIIPNNDIKTKKKKIGLKPSVKHHSEVPYPVKILLAEDNVLNQKIAISILKRLGYVDVVIASHGREVLELMRHTSFDVIFMDLYMPEMDGLEATRQIIAERQSNQPCLLNVQDIYIIALTASASKQDRQICIDAGMNDFISKPFTMQEMKLALRNQQKNKHRKKQ
ncbi:hypothetical protein EDC96DRAFT_534036 [Choanephora cucurbitarum]|nr:hypothetical protein EDC96DRAFT_534036 [Choanephora cucurbitarum]